VKAAEFGKDVKCIIVDSVAALAPEAELAGEIGDQTIGLQARLMSRCMRAITPLLARNNVLLLCINQIRDKIGAAAGYGCVDGDSIIALGNNSQSKIISLKENTKIKSFNCDKQKVEKTECITLLKNGVSGEFHELTYISIFNRDSKKLIITPEHSVFSYGDMQWKKCKELRPYNSFVLSVDSDKVRKKEQLTASFFVEEGQVKAKDNTGIELTMTPYLCARAYLEMKDKAELIKQTLCKILREKLSEYEFSRLVTFVKNLINIEEMGAVPSLVTSNRPIDGERERYDLMVDKNENYFANDLLIHNSPETTPGGRALRFYASVRMEIRRIGAINSRQMDLGSKVRVRILKNKFAAPFKSADTEIYYGKGILKESELLELAEQNRIVERSGSWYSYRGEKLGQGRENIIVLLRTDKKLLKSVEDELAKM
jgi:recombination protein RecA